MRAVACRGGHEHDSDMGRVARTCVGGSPTNFLIRNGAASRFLGFSEHRQGNSARYGRIARYPAGRLRA